ncbi:MAG: hypothetical protein JRH20_26290, partial [Deltaproteobacteria bacterium]|nr:hypothetical protein [Deltaproteobacteria bacterium]
MLGTQRSRLLIGAFTLSFALVSTSCGDDTAPPLMDSGPVNDTAGDQLQSDALPLDTLGLDALAADGAASDGTTPPCGNGVIDPTESCDTAIAEGLPGACPTGCDDGNACTSDALQGADCQLTCAHEFITTCSGTTEDSCCPKICDNATDSDCAVVVTCGDGNLDKGESCDTAIPEGSFGACPTGCDDGNACTSDSLLGADCNVICSNALIAVCSKEADGCCPTGCTTTTDPDCAAPTLCGNTTIDKGETCDTAIKPPLLGSCPTSCDDGNGCTIDSFSGSDCTLDCVNTTITRCSLKLEDGCCPAGCTNVTDADCTTSDVCGNATLDKGETCDTAIKPPLPGSCPATCDDGNACTIDFFTGSDCTLACGTRIITVCSLKRVDGCCPAGCTEANDADCAPVDLCGDGTLDKGETCDTAIKPPLPGSCPASCDDGNSCTIDFFTG